MQGIPLPPVGPPEPGPAGEEALEFDPHNQVDMDLPGVTEEEGDSLMGIPLPPVGPLEPGPPGTETPVPGDPGSFGQPQPEAETPVPGDQQVHPVSGESVGGQMAMAMLGQYDDSEAVARLMAEQVVLSTQILEQLQHGVTMRG